MTDKRALEGIRIIEGATLAASPPMAGDLMLSVDSGSPRVAGSSAHGWPSGIRDAPSIPMGQLLPLGAVRH